MLRFMGNTLAKSCPKGRLQYRDFSSVSEHAVSKFYGYFFKATFGGAGFLVAGKMTSPVSPRLQEIEEDIEDMQFKDTFYKRMAELHAVVAEEE